MIKQRSLNKPRDMFMNLEVMLLRLALNLWSLGLSLPCCGIISECHPWVFVCFGLVFLTLSSRDRVISRHMARMPHNTLCTSGYPQTCGKPPALVSGCWDGRCEPPHSAKEPIFRIAKRGHQLFQGLLPAILILTMQRHGLQIYVNNDHKLHALCAELT